MALHYILDGYNIVNKMPSLLMMNLEQSREKFVHLIQNYRPQGSIKNKITIVFDGQAGLGCQIRQTSLVEILFSFNESADEKIKSMIENSSAKKSMVVVTDDREIQYYVRAFGAQICPVNTFLEKIEQCKENIHKPKKGKNISADKQTQINEEFKKIWLREND